MGSAIFEGGALPAATRHDRGSPGRYRRRRDDARPDRDLIDSVTATAAHQVGRDPGVRTTRQQHD